MLYKNFTLSIGGAWLAAVILMLYAGIFGGIIAYFGMGNIPEDWITLLGYSIPFILFIISFYMVYLKPKNEQYNWNFSSKHAFIFPISIILFFGIVLVNEYITSLIPTTGPILGDLYDTMEATFNDIIQYPTISYITIALIAPVLEELVFRGIFLKGMLQKGISPQTAILISALIFGIIHMNPWQFIGAFSFGLLFGWLYYKTGSLLWGILLHFINNSLGFLLFLEYGDMDLKDLSGYSMAETVGFGLILIAIGLYLMKKIGNKADYLWGNKNDIIA